MAPGIVAEGVDHDILLRAMDENLWAFWRDYGRAPGAELHEDPTFAGSPRESPWLSSTASRTPGWPRTVSDPHWCAPRPSPTDVACLLCGGSARALGRLTSRRASSNTGSPWHGPWSGWRPTSPPWTDRRPAYPASASNAWEMRSCSDSGR